MTIVCFNTKLQQEKNSLDHSDFFSTTFDNSETKMGFDKTNTSSSSNTNTKNTNTMSSNSGSSQKSSSSSAFGSFFYNTNSSSSSSNNGSSKDYRGMNLWMPQGM